MKKLFLAVMILLFATTCFAEIRIIRIDKNNVEVQEVLFRDRGGKEEVIISRESYGQNRIDQERTNAQTNLDAIDAMTAEEYKNKARKAFIDHKVKLEKVQKKMNEIHNE